MDQKFVERKACPGCGHEKNENLLSTSFAAQYLQESMRRNFGLIGIDIPELMKEVEYQLCECNNCGLIFQRNCFSEEFMGQIYQQRSLAPEVQARDSVKQLHKSAFYAGEVVTMIKMLKRNPENIDALDFGMGWGHWCSMARAYGCNVFGFDVSERKKEFARENGITTVDELPDSRFDYINTEQVLEHVLYPLETVRMLYQSLKPGGILKISVPNGELVRARKLRNAGRPADKHLYLVSPLMHINTFNCRAITTMAETAGMKALKIPTRYQFANLHLLGAKEAVKAILRPLYRRMIRTTYLHFAKPGAG
jgi:2-polyprenyl-3-methyl-5-hydroxy-6-metoxy-1,4-benzoquinol methylase